MKKSNLIFAFLSLGLLLAACSSPSEGGGGGGSTPSEPSTDGKIKEIALKSTARTTVSVTERIATNILYDIKANKGQSLKSADKKVKVTSSDQTILKVENTGSVVSTFLQALKPGNVTLTVQSQVQENITLEIPMVVKDAVFDRQAIDGFHSNNWDNVDFTHEVDETDPYVKTIAEEDINHQFYFRNSNSTYCYAECEFTFYSELDGTAHLPKVGFAFTTNQENDTGMDSVSFIYFDTDCSGGKTRYYNIGYNEIANGAWGWDRETTLAQHCNLYHDEVGVEKGEMFKMGVVKDGFNYHVYFNDVYVKSIKATLEGFSTDSTHTEAAPTTAGLFDFKSEVKYQNYHYTEDQAEVAAKIPATPDFK